MWELGTGREVTTLRGHRGGLCALQFDAQKLVTASEDRTVRLWDYGAERELAVLHGHKAWVRSLHYNDKFLWSGYTGSSFAPA
jgi:F-box/WD-40 domain protein MET30